jgi:hypothetical protein
MHGFSERTACGRRLVPTAPRQRRALLCAYCSAHIIVDPGRQQRAVDHDWVDLTCTLPGRLGHVSSPNPLPYETA